MVHVFSVFHVNEKRYMLYDFFGFLMFGDGTIPLCCGYKIMSFTTWQTQ